MKKKSVKFWTLIFLNIIFIACHKQKDVKKNSLKLKKTYEDEINNAKSIVKSSGDEISYSDLVLYYLNNKSRKEEIIPYTILMVEKHKKFKYASKVFENFFELYTDTELKYDGTRKSLILYLKNIEKLNIYQKNYLLYYLKIGSKNKNLASVRYLEILNSEGIGIPKNIQVGDSLKKQINDLEIINHVR